MSYSLQIITPQGKVYDSEVEHLEVPGDPGFVGVLSHHAPFITSSIGGRLSIREKGGKTRTFNIGIGFFETHKNQAVLMAESFSERS